MTKLLRRPMRLLPAQGDVDELIFAEEDYSVSCR